MTSHPLTAASPRSWWWEAVRAGEAITITVSFSGPLGTFGLMASPTGASPWTVNRSARAGQRLTITLPPAANAGLWRIGLARYSGMATASVTITTGKATMPLQRLTRSAGGLPAGTIVQRKGEPLAAPGVTAGFPISSVFSTTSEWRRDVSAAPLHPDSAAMVASWVQTDLVPYYGGVAAFNVNSYSTAVYVVDDTVEPVAVGYRNEQGKSGVPSQLYKAGSGAHFLDCPLLPDMIPAAGNDGHLCVYRPTTDQLWDFWRAKYDAPTGTYGQVRGVTAANASPAASLSPDTTTFPGWSAVWGGRVDNVSTTPGWFPAGMGASASGLITSAGALGVRETQAALAASSGLGHALSLAVINARDGVKSWPAQRTDGASSNPLALPEGIRLRLPTSYDVEASNLHPLAKVVARTAQTYGFLVTDKAGAVNVFCESGQPFAAETGTNPWTAMLAGAASYQVLKNFPWALCEVLPVDHGLAP